MPVFFYQTKNTNRNEPLILEGSNYVHIKAKGDGSETAIMADAKINHPELISHTQKSLDILLQSWNDDENKKPEIDSDGNPMIQSKPVLENYLDEKQSDFNTKADDIANLDRIQRGVVLPGDEDRDFETFREKMTQAEEEIFDEKLSVLIDEGHIVLIKAEDS